MTSSPASCYHCSLPLPRSPYQAEASGALQSFCCYGCYLVNAITGERGDAGETQWIYYRLGAAIFLTVNIMMFNMALYSEYFYSIEGGEQFHSLLRYLLLALSTPVFVLLGFPILRSSWHGLRNLVFTMDVLIVIGVASAYLLSAYATLTERGEIYFETMAMVLLLVTIGRYLEAKAKVKSTFAIKELLARSPSECTAMINGEEKKIAATDVKVGDVLKILPGENFCVDGIVVNGESSVDESMLTGESKPVFKSVGSKVFAGTSNYDGCLFVQATEVGEEKVLSRFTRLLEEARNSRAPIERLADRISSIAIPLIVLAAGGTLLYWTLTSGIERGLMNALSVLLISCPCALGIATPMAVWIALGQAAKRGILIQRAEALEQLAHIRAVVFDKTGTLTERQMRVSEIIVEPDGREKEKEFLRITASLEAHSEHPLARSVVQYAKEHDIEMKRVEQLQIFPGLGVKGIVNGVNSHTEDSAVMEVVLGSQRFMERMNIHIGETLSREKEEVEKSGRTVVCVSWGDGTMNGHQCKGLIAYSEALRMDARKVVDSLKLAGLKISILTGDNVAAGNALQKKLNVDVKAELLPDDKVKELLHLRESVGPTLFVGDGINDVPALSAATVGVAMGCGSDITREAAHVNFLGDDLTNVPWLLQLARKTYRIIKVNLFWAFIYNLVGIGLAIAGVLTPIFAAAAMVLSSVFFVRNSLRLKSHPKTS
jgi:Cu2+-exporting ATPase/Cu+-exporting ATPase